MGQIFFGRLMASNFKAILCLAKILMRVSVIWSYQQDRWQEGCIVCKVHNAGVDMVGDMENAKVGESGKRYANAKEFN